MRLARASAAADQTRRLLALAVIYDGGGRAEAAGAAGVDRQIIRDWVERFNAEGADGLVSPVQQLRADGSVQRFVDRHGVTGRLQVGTD